MNRALRLALACVVTCSASPAFAEGMTLSLRSSGGFGVADSPRGTFVSDLTADSLAATVDVGYRWDPMGRDGPAVELAVFGGLGVHEAYRVGVEALLHFLPYGAVRPWGGIGTGFAGALSGGSERELVDLQLGVDFPVAPMFALGPFITATLGSTDVPALAGSRGFAHGSMLVGFKATFGP